MKDILKARTRGGAAIILTAHMVEVAARLADHIGILSHGHLVTQGTLAELQATIHGSGSSLEDVSLQ
jgi:ABC-2 type transport system ATP-binding protein